MAKVGYGQGLFWLGFFLLEWLSAMTYVDDYRRSFYFVCLDLPIFLLAGYWHLLVTVRHFFLAGRMPGFWLSLLGGIVVLGLLRRSVNYYWYDPANYPVGLAKPFLYWPKLASETIYLHLIAGVFTAIELGRHALRQQQASEIYRREKLAAEYQLLQSQVQPHFLFNTLNNLSSVALHRPAQLPQLLQQLAGLLRYQLRESHQTRVPLRKEIGYLTDYIALEQIRYGKRLAVQTNFTAVKPWDDLLIPPMLLLPFVENAFKHGAAKTEDPCWIHVQLTYTDNELRFSVENSRLEGPTSGEAAGLGLSNLKQRLDILFPHTYELATFSEESQFLAVLRFSPSMAHTPVDARAITHLPNPL